MVEDGEKQETEKSEGGNQMSHCEGFVDFAKIPGLILRVLRNNRRLLSKSVT